METGMQGGHPLKNIIKIKCKNKFEKETALFILIEFVRKSKDRKNIYKISFFDAETGMFIENKELNINMLCRKCKDGTINIKSKNISEVIENIEKYTQK